MTLPLSLARAIHLGKLCWADLDAMAKRTLEAHDRRRKRHAPARTKKRATKAERATVSAVIREMVFARAAGRCEFAPPGSLSHPPSEWHHIIGGGLRRKRETVDTTAAVCAFCHRLWHEGDTEVLHNAKEWAIRNGFRGALRAVEKRIAKVDEARRASRTDTSEETP